MAELEWKYAQNQFLAVTDGRRPLMLAVGADHTAKLAAKLGSPADPDIQACIDRAQPAFDDFQLQMVTWSAVSGQRKGQTEALTSLLDELRSQRIRTWDVAIQNVHPSDTPSHTQLLPQGRGPFQSGKQDQRILAVQTLGVALAAFPEFATLQTTVETFHASLQAARNTQQGTEGQIASASAAAEAARVSMAVALFANVGRLMEKHADDPSRLGDYYEVSLLRSSSSSNGDGDDPVPEPLATPVNLSVTTGPSSDLIATWDAVDDAVSYTVEQQQVGIDPDFTEAGTTSEVTLTFGNYAPGTTVQVRVRATGAPGTTASLNSDVVEVTT